MVDYYVRVLKRAAGEAWNVTVQQVVPGFIMGALGLRLSYGLGETLPAYARGLIAILDDVGSLCGRRISLEPFAGTLFARQGFSG